MSSTKIDEEVFEKLAGILKKHSLSEIEYAYKDSKFRLTSGTYMQNVSNSFVPGAEVSREKVDPPKNIAYEDHPGSVKSPMVGTVYLAPEPGAANFVAIGDVVQEGQPLLIIEAMKVMNLIKSSRSGKVVHIAISNADPVEFGQLLFVIE